MNREKPESFEEVFARDVPRAHFGPTIAWVTVLVAAMSTAASNAAVPASARPAGTEVEGFTEPLRTIHVAAEEMGTIEEVLVREGEAVAAGQPLARLNSTVHRAMLAMAEQTMQSEGRLDAARAELDLRRERLEKLEPLCLEGHARQEELDRAVIEVRIAEANLRAAHEEQVAKQLDRDRILAQVESRTVRAPVDGVVTLLHRQAGEFVGPNSPEVVTIVQIDVLLANLTLSGAEAGKLKLGQDMVVSFGSGLSAPATVDFVSPVTNAESGTVLVKLRIDNAEGRFRAGDRCRVRLAE